MGEGAVTEADDPTTFRRVLVRASRALEAAGVDHLVFASIAVATYGKPTAAGDVDVLLRPADERAAREALEGAGFRTDETDQTWLSKAERDGVLVDLIVQLTGSLFLDDEMLAASRRVAVDGHEVRMISPEDQVIVAAASNSAEAQVHWYDAVSILMRTPLDWRYLLGRSRLAPRRMLSLLIYAESEDVEVPRWAIDELFARVYDTGSRRSIVASP